MGIDVGRRSIVEWAENAPEESGGEFEPSARRFVVEAPIGEGGMGEVFLVQDKDLRRQVAMIVLRAEAMGSRAHRIQFVAEAQTTSQLDHPGVPPVHDIGIDEGGRPYFTLKLVRGRTLGEVIHDLLLRRRDVQKEYTLHRLVGILERVAETFQFTHERGVIHRDLKPDNVMLGDYGEVHVIDWGLARVEGESDELLDLAEEAEVDRVEIARTEAGLHTQHGTIKGTVPYMSPEHLRGEAVLRAAIFGTFPTSSRRTEASRHTKVPTYRRTCAVRFAGRTNRRPAIRLSAFVAPVISSKFRQQAGPSDVVLDLDLVNAKEGTFQFAWLRKRFT